MFDAKAFGAAVGAQIKAGVAAAVGPVLERMAALEEWRKAMQAMPVPKDGRDGINGKDGAPGVAGKDGAAGIDGKDGAPGAPGEPGDRKSVV